MTQIAFLGLGAMGSRMAANLAKVGFDLTVWNRDPARAKEFVQLHAAKYAETIRDAVNDADVVVSMVRDDAASADVWLNPQTGALAGMKPGGIALECSTLTLAFAVRLATEAQRHNVDFSDAPVAGSRPQAEQAQLVFMVGADENLLNRLRPVLSAMGSQVLQTGAVGSGMAVKLAVNALLGIEASAVAELLGLLSRLGVDVNKAMDVISATSVASPAIKGLASGMMSQNFAPQFPIELLAKDLVYLLQTGVAAKSALPVSQAVAQLVDQAVHAGLGRDHITGLWKLYGKG